MPQAALTGPGVCKGTYASEFGGVAISSFESLSPTLDPSHWALHAAPMSERNYAVDNFVVAVANLTWPDRFNTTGKVDFQGKLFFAQLAQALWVKSDIESRRSQNSWGCITWQFNEIWPTGGWGSIEYGTIGFTPGQVEGGRWKALQYFMRRYIYRNAYIAASNAARIIVRNDDAFAPLNGLASLSFLSLVNGALLSSSNFSVNLPRGGGATVWSCADPSVDYLTQPCPSWSVILQKLGCATDGSDCVAMLTLRDSTSGALIAENFELLQPPSALALPNTVVTATVNPSINPDGSVDITLSTSNTAIFVTLTTLAQGRFSDNAIFLSPGNTEISFIPWSTLDLALLTSSLRVEHAASYPRNV